MKRYQTGEVMLVVMAVMMAIIWLGNGHMGTMGQGASHAEKSGASTQQEKAGTPVPPAPKEPSEHQPERNSLR